MTKKLLLPKKLWLTMLVASSITLSVQPSYSLEVLPLQPEKQEYAAKLREAEVYNNKGVELAQQGNFKQAIAAFNQALKIHPNYENAHNNLGLALGSQKKFSEATSAFKQALTINPSNFETYNNLGIALGSLGKYPEAVAAFNQAIQINPKDPTSYQNLGIAFWSQGKLPNAVASLQKARELYSKQNNPDGINYIEDILQQISPLPQ